MVADFGARTRLSARVACPDRRRQRLADGIDAEAVMLAKAPVHPVLLAKDLDAPRDFYGTILGLPVLVDRGEEAVEFSCGDGTKLVVTKSTTGTADSQTQVGWIVEDLRAEIAELRGRGVKIEEYDLPDFKTQDGIADFGFAWMAWIVDPGGNALAIIEEKPPRP
jgi:catechol 2,3-dioxygenase-like lactoylglutathione lyase family enzyme